jgi:hypothetical protein
MPPIDGAKTAGLEPAKLITYPIWREQIARRLYLRYANLKDIDGFEWNHTPMVTPETLNSLAYRMIIDFKPLGKCGLFRPAATRYVARKAFPPYKI